MHSTTAPCVADQSEFEVDINDSPEADELEDVTACDNYTLPSLSAVINTGQQPEVQGHNCLLVM
ncbi:hypothetical protein LZ575_12235 [Antarcticibacterium sp. 1MA-6-2]|uniref:hypothetical protein n=1 Tax=Antarcticibacterium sp. 1MA-6-2 TaxID=2908210 RepID=UPI001F1A67C9|nr:hypothetical protein [Antarcticibacterium sp. 1MA-6-2]UJH89792.1 hypothetical protein LZ575_12235 [Antarcticibacterium sp. 1MA-6-2]